MLVNDYAMATLKDLKVHQVDVEHRNLPKVAKVTTKYNLPLPETSIFAPKNGWLEFGIQAFPIEEAHFQGRTVSFREGI